MKLKFSQKNDKVDVKIVEKDNTEIEFSYVKMIDRIYNDESIEEPIIEGDFSSEEEYSILSLISEMSKNVESIFQRTEEDILNSEASK
ncbi:MAG: hypothetical protein GX217_02765 [Clostridiaceae bacterium]|nr:hypothetical protein [Clostridiaceae bacterium]